MINEERLVKLFKELCLINAPALQEKDCFDFVYGHMKGRSRVGAGKLVRAGQRLGSVGQTGTDSGVCHLHFELWKGRWFAGGSRADPLPHLRAWDHHSGGPLQAEPKPPPGQYSASKRLFYDSAE